MPFTVPNVTVAYRFSSRFFQAERRLIGRREKPRLFINVPDEPVRPPLLAFHVEAPAEGAAGLQHPKDLPISGFFIRERVKAVQRQNNVKGVIRIGQRESLLFVP